MEPAHHPAHPPPHPIAPQDIEPEEADPLGHENEVIAEAIQLRPHKREVADQPEVNIILHQAAQTITGGVVGTAAVRVTVQRVQVEAGDY